MRHHFLCVAAVLSLTALGGTALHPAQAGSVMLAGSTENSPVYSLSFRKYKWEIPEFRMAGKEAFLIVRIENPHDYDLSVTIRCLTKGEEIPQLSGMHSLKPHEFMYVDTRRLRDPMQRGKGVRVKCWFRANGPAKVDAWIYDEGMRVAHRNAVL